MSSIPQLHFGYLMARRRLHRAVDAECPGKHAPRRHRDGMPPWCDDCGKSALGIQIRVDRA